MKKIISAALSLCLVFSLLSSSLTASAAGSASLETMQQTVRALGIIVGDDTGSMRLTSYVTRAEFAKMMVAASSFKDSVGTGTGFSLFKDVKSDHWAVEYINVARTNGWFVGYSDGNFRPENNITLEEAATSVLRLLSYTSSDIVGSYPTAQLSKFNSLGLNVNLTRGQGELVTRADCVVIFYNLMTATTKNNAVYATTLKYTLNASGELDFASLVANNMKGPFVLTGGSSLSSLLPFYGSNITVYKNGVESSLSSASTYDVYYYSKNMRTVWIYNTRVIGTYTNATPSRISPTAVTVAGNSYTIGTSTASYKLSVMGGFNVGDTLTLLLGMDGKVVDVLPAGATDTNVGGTITYYGVVTFSGNVSYTDSSGKVVNENNVKVACSDGVTRQFSGSNTVGAVVKITLTGSNVSISGLSRKSISGLVDSNAATFAGYSLSPDLQILDTNSKGAAMVIYPSRIAGAQLSSSDVLYYELDASGKINLLILNDATGDIYKYGILTSIKTKEGSNTRGSYSAILNGASSSISTSSYFNVGYGPAVFRYNGDGSLSAINSLRNVDIDSLSSLYAEGNGQKLRLAENLQIYISTGSNTYDYTGSTQPANLSNYSLTAYYDDLDYSAGGRVRVIIATAKS